MSSSLSTHFRNYDQDGDFHNDYPYIKSRSGALFTRNRMPWDWQRNTNYGFSSAFLCGAIGTLLHFVR